MLSFASFSFALFRFVLLCICLLRCAFLCIGSLGMLSHLFALICTVSLGIVLNPFDFHSFALRSFVLLFCMACTHRSTHHAHPTFHRGGEGGATHTTFHRGSGGAPRTIPWQPTAARHILCARGARRPLTVKHIWSVRDIASPVDRP